MVKSKQKEELFNDVTRRSVEPSISAMFREEEEVMDMVIGGKQYMVMWSESTCDEQKMRIQQ